MGFLKKHYEKILLSAVLLILAATAVWLFISIDKKKQELDITLMPPSKTKKVDPVDLSAYRKALERLKNPPSVSFDSPHLLLNPAVWKQKADGSLVKLVAQDLPRIVEINPLNLVIAYEGTSGTAESVTGYKFRVTKEAAPRPQDRKPVQRYISATGKRETDAFTLKEIQGPAENPTGFLIELNDSKQQAVVTPGQPFKRIEGYAANLKYELENRAINDLRIGSPLVFGGERYKVVAMNTNEVTVQADSNQKQTTIQWKSNP